MGLSGAALGYVSEKTVLLGEIIVRSGWEMRTNFALAKQKYHEHETHIINAWDVGHDNGEHGRMFR